MEKVSIIVPVYNGEKTVAKCVESLLAQTYKNLEIILINDGSTDGTYSILSDFKKRSDVIKIVDQKNSGVACARNNGLKLVSGEYIMFVDCDDYLDFNCIEAIIEKSKQYNADITRFKITYTYCDGTFITENDDFDGETFIKKAQFKEHIYMKMLSGIKLNSICRTLYKKNTLDNLFFEKNMTTAEDLIFNIEAFTNASSFLYLPYPYYFYYQSGAGLTGNGISILTKYKCNFIVSLVLLKHLKSWNMLSPKYIFMAIFRLYIITLLKIKRSVLRDV